jgi:Flp pilus assembly protein TadD
MVGGADRRGPGGEARRRRLTALLALLLALAAVLTFLPVAGNGFVNFDDDDYLLDNPRVREGLTWGGIRWALTATWSHNWHPLTWISHMADVSLFGLDPAGHHLVSAGVHAANAVLLFLLLALATGRVWPPALGAALFALHPLRVESVAWAAERKDVLSACLYLAAAAAHVRHARRPGGGRYAAVLLLFALALLAKPMAVTLPLALLLLDFWPLGRLGRPGDGGRLHPWALLAEKVPLLLLSAASALVTYLVQASTGALNLHLQQRLLARLRNGAVSAVHYLVHTVWPEGLAVFYPFREEGGPWTSLAALALLAGLTLAVLLARRRAPWAAFGWGWYLAAVLPVLGLVQVGGQAMADRYTYLPSAGLMSAAAWGTARLLRGRRALVPILPAALLLLFLLAGLTRRQVAHWRDSVTLFGHAVAVTEGNWLAWSNLGHAFYSAGDNRRAVDAYQRALEDHGAYVQARNNLALALVGLGRFPEALSQYREAVRLAPDYQPAHLNLGALLARLGSLEEALAEYREALRLDPGSAEAHNNLGTLLLRLSRTEEAEGHFRTALGLKEYYADARFNLGLALELRGRDREALAEYRAAALLLPGEAQVRERLAEVERRLAP